MKDTFTAAQRGDLTAYGRIVTRYQDMAVGYAFSILRDFHLAQDAAQEAFIEAFPTLSKVHAIEAFPSWLRRIVLKRCDRLTRKGRAYTFASVEDAVILPSREPTPDRVTEDREMHGLLNDAIAELPDHEREVVSLFYISDRSQDEVSTFLDIPVSTVKNRLRSARNRMREKLLVMVEDNLRANRPSKDGDFVEGVLNIVAPVKEKDSEAIYTRLEEKGRADMARQARNGRIADSHFDWKTSRVGMVDGKIATYVGVYELNFQIGYAVVKAAGINWLDLDKTLADESVLQETLVEALKAMGENGYDIAVTRSEPPARLEPQGFVQAMPVQESYFVDVKDLPAEPPEVQLVRVHANDIHGRQDLAELYNQWHKGLTGASVRPTYHRGKCPPNDEDDYPAYIFKDDAGTVVGYLYDGPFKDKKIHTHSDSAGDPEQILRVLAQTLKEYDIKEIRFLKMPYDSPLARRIRRGTYRMSKKNIDNDGRSACMIRVINLRSTLEKMSGVLSERVKQSHLANWSGAIALEADDQTAMLRIENGKVSLTDSATSNLSVKGDHSVAQLLLGSECASEVCAGKGIDVIGDASGLLDVLFPAQRPQMPNEDL